MKPLILFFLIVFFIAFSTQAQKSDIKQLKHNLINDALINQGYAPRVERYINSDYSKARQYLKSLGNNGAWKDIDYSDRDNNWHPLNHLDRILVMTYNYSKDTSQLYHNRDLLAGIEKAIGYWYKVNPECDNWYKNRIAKQFYFNVIALLLDGKIDESLHANMVNDLTETPTMTGSNRTLLATSTFYRGVLTKDSEMIKLGVSGVTDQIEITAKEGIQPDYSFHQHGHFIYNGSYGFNFLRESIWLATIVHGTQFAFSGEHIKILRDYYLNGTRWMIRGGLIDYNVRGRQVGRADAMKLYADLLIPILSRLIIADPEFANDYQTSIELIEKQKPQETFGHKHFWRSDYTIHHREKYSTSLKMCSERTVGIELNMNSENKLGYWLPYGLTYIYRKGNEYDGIFPVWNWAKLPGVTNPKVTIEETGKGVAHTQQTSFVGGLCDGKYGISVMNFSKNKTKAKKAWFWFDDEWVAIGSGVESEHDSIIITSINQTLRKSPVVVKTKDGIKKSQKEIHQSLQNAKWVLHDSVGYVFPVKMNIELSSSVQKGNMKRIYGLGKDSVYAEPVFSLWIDHGLKPQNGSYQYIVVPGINEYELENYSKNSPPIILNNNKQLQVVAHKNLQLTGVVFHDKGMFENEQLKIKVDHPCLILLDEKKHQITLSEPTARLNEIEISVVLNEQVVFNQAVKLPLNGEAGKSVTLNFN